MSRVPTPLVCFAVPEETKYFSVPGAVTLVTGMGRKNAERELLRALESVRASMVLTCGFAGGLNRDLAVGTVIFDAEDFVELKPILSASGALPARIHCADRVATTAREKQALRETSGADAVEMESGYLRTICRARDIPSATIRVISDAADEDLPIDFNRLMTDQQKLSFTKLAAALAAAPGKISALLRLRKQTDLAARNLGRVLEAVVDCCPNR